MAGALDQALAKRDLLGHGLDSLAPEVIRLNREALAKAFGEFVNPADSWGDGFSTSLLRSMHDAGIDRALLLLSNLYGNSLRPEVVDHAHRLGFLLGPYDSYHSVHSPSADPDDSWETAQFDLAAYEHGRVINADGSGHAGIKTLWQRPQGMKG